MTAEGWVFVGVICFVMFVIAIEIARSMHGYRQQPPYSIERKPWNSYDLDRDFWTGDDVRR
jgi:hypothetical protein